MSKKKTYEELIKQIFDLVGNDYIVLSEAYNSTHDKIKFKHNIDECGHEFEMEPNAFLSSGQRCPIHRKNLKLTNEDYVKKLSILNPSIETLEKYINGITSIKVKCKIDGYEWTPKANTLIKSNARGCPMCAIRNNSGENCPLWNGGITEIKKYLREKIKPWILDSIIKDDNKCIITGKKKQKVVHHLSVQFYKILEEIFLETEVKLKRYVNDYSDEELKILSELCLRKHYEYGLGITLNKDIHNEFHRIYGSINNTKEQFIEFSKNKGKDIINII